MRIAYLQRLLFVIDRHWLIFHAELQNEVISTLLQLVTLDDPLAQSWTFLCFAALALVHVPNPETQDVSQWDAIWNHAMRRTNSSNVCRAACHAAHVLLISDKLPQHRILAEIETMAQDISVQGPLAPYDSVCLFFIECIKVAVQDVRLYKIQLEEKVLGWLTENWDALEGTGRGAGSGSQGRSKNEQCTIQDMISLMETVCGLNKRSHLLCDIALPPCAIVDAVKSQKQSNIIREFLLYARLPPFRRPKASANKPRPPSISPHPDAVYRSDKELAQPSSRERKVSAFLLKTLDALTAFWESREETSSPQAETVRRSIDLAVLGIAFESSLVVNGIRSNRRVLLAGCKLIEMVSPLLRALVWSPEETVFILLGFAPLTAERFEEPLGSGWTALIEPGKLTGVRRNVLSPDTLPQGPSEDEDKTARQRLQKAIWQSSDVSIVSLDGHSFIQMQIQVQDAFAATLTTFKSMLESLGATQTNGHQQTSDAMMIDADDFDPIRTTRATPGLTNNLQHNPEANAHVKRLSSLIVNFLAMAPVLQSSDGQSTREKFIADLVCKCDDHKFTILGHPYLHHVQIGHVYMSSSTLNKLLDRFEGLLMSYAYSRSEPTLLLAIHVLMASTDVWLQRQSLDPELSNKVRQLCQWFSDMLRQKKMRSWRIRDCLIRFYDFYLSLDPKQSFLTREATGEEEELDPEALPDRLMPTVSADEDIRVRFTVAVSCARLQSSSYIDDKDPTQVYDNMREYLCVQLSK